MGAESLEITFQLLSCGVSIGYEDPALTKNLSYMTVQARQSVAVSKALSYQVSGYGPYDIHEEGDLLDRAQDPEEVLFHVYGRVYHRLLERYALAGWLVLHAGVVRMAGKRMLLLGNKGAGKTTLMLRLLYAGHQFEGDELVLARAGEVMAAPRRLHLKPGIEKNVPELVAHLEELPFSFSADLKTRALDPTSLGFDWLISAGAVDHVIWISPNHGGLTELETLQPFPMLQRLLESYLGWGESKNAVVECTSSLARSGGYNLVLGAAAAAVTRLEILAKSNV